MRHIKKITLVFLIFFVFSFYIIQEEWIQQNDLRDGETNASNGSITRIPSAYSLDVPFTSQAPYANWGLPYQEACEEASLLMAWHYFRGETNMPKKKIDSEIQKIVAWEIEYFGYYKHTDATQTAKMAERYLGLKAKLVYDVSVHSIKRELLAGNIVVIPTAGRLLGNPYYTGEGPVYHMLVIRGWDRKGFITNDPGTRRGENYRFPETTIMNAIHDWNEKDIYAGQRVLISISKGKN